MRTRSGLRISPEEHGFERKHGGEQRERIRIEGFRACQIPTIHNAVMKIWNRTK
jgi:hypothetical protein